jgi:hypothetical protein
MRVTRKKDVAVGADILNAIEDRAGGLVLECQGMFVVARWTWESYLVWVAQGFREVGLSPGKNREEFGLWRIELFDLAIGE